MIKVLVVDDSVIDLQIIAGMLDSKGIECITVDDPKDAMKAAVKYQPNIVLLDIHMPGVNGLDLCKQIKDNPETSSITVMFLSADNTGGVEAAGIFLGSVAYLNKPFNAQSIAALIIAQDTAMQIHRICEPLRAKSEAMAKKYSG